MDVFKLCGNIAIENTQAVGAVKKTSEEAEKAEGKISKAFSKVGSAAVKVGKTIAAGLAVGSAAITAVGKDALDSYANYEQLVGGVETLFGAGGQSLEEYAASVGKTTDAVKEEYEALMKAQDTVMKSASNAYKTAGLSANEYMETVTSFSASLLQSLGGDTVAAAQKADQAIIDMSDNANKMGSSMESIQNAYQGFAKQNYTMLDNLKLGYGGTKEEMERLLADAQAISGIEYNIESYADVVDAIHVIQEEMGIAGTTAKEASSTISGSIASMKSSWANLMTGIADENQNVSTLLDTFVDSVTTVGDNVLPRVQTILEGMSGAINDAVPTLVRMLPKTIQSVLPSLLESAGILINSIITVIVQALPTLLKSVIDVFSMILESLVDMLPDVIGAIKTLIIGVVKALPKLMKTLFSALPTIIPMLIDALVSMVMILVENITDILQPIIDNLQVIIITLVDALMDNLPLLIQGLITLVVTLVDATPEIIMALIEALPMVVMSIVDGLWNSLPILLQGMKDMLLSVFRTIGLVALGIVDILSEPFSKAVSAIKNVFAPIGDFFKGVWSGIKNAFGNITDWFGNTFSKAWQAVKNVFSAGGKVFEGIKDGIVSVFKTVVNALITGINKVISVPFKAINTMLNKIRSLSIAGVKPFDWIKKDLLPIPEIPHLETGGVLEKGQVGLLEGNGAEAVVPLDKNEKWIRRVAEDMNNAIGGNNNAVVKKLDELIQAITSLKVYLDSDVLVGEIAPSMDYALAGIYSSKGRGR